MGSKSDYLEKRLLDHVVGGVVFTPPATLHLALFVAGTGGEDGLAGDTEVAGGAYARAAVANTVANFPGATGNSPSRKTNANLILWPTATADWGTPTHWAMMDAATAGNVLYWGEFTVEQRREIKAGDTATIAAGVLSITED